MMRMLNWMLLVSIVQLVTDKLADMPPDLELLAQQKNHSTFQPSNPAFQHPTPEEEEVFTGSKHEDALPQKSRFFDCEYLVETTPDQRVRVL
jgi:hypothetical protein